MKKALIPMFLLMLLFTFSSCASQKEPAATAQPSVLPSPTTDPAEGMMDSIMPDMTNEPAGAMNDALTPAASEQPAAHGVTSLTDARKAIESIEDELERLSEVDDAQVVIAGKDAAVALEFDSQYRGGVDDRLRGIVKDRINGVISGVDNIVITTDKALMEQLEALGDRLEGAADMADIQSELSAIIKKIESAAA